MAPPDPNFAPNSSLTPPQQRVIDILADGGTTAGAAAAIGVHRNTVRNWRRCIPNFARELDLALREQALHWQQQAVTLAPHAIETLRTILHNESAPLSQKLRAATIILKMATEPKTPRHTPRTRRTCTILHSSTFTKASRKINRNRARCPPCSRNQPKSTHKLHNPRSRSLSATPPAPATPVENTNAAAPESSPKRERRSRAQSSVFLLRALMAY